MTEPTSTPEKPSRNLVQEALFVFHWAVIVQLRYVYPVVSLEPLVYRGNPWLRVL